MSDDPKEWHGLSFDRVKEMWCQHAARYTHERYHGEIVVPIMLEPTLSWAGPYRNPFEPTTDLKKLRFQVKHEVNYGDQLQCEAVYCGDVLIDTSDVRPL